MLQTPEARDLMLDRMWATAPGALVEVGLRNAAGVELDPVECPGYARYTVTSYGSFWQPAAGGVKSSVVFSLPATTDAWDDAAVEDCIYVDGVAFDAAPLLEPLVVDGAGSGPRMRVSRRFDEGV